MMSPPRTRVPVGWLCCWLLVAPACERSKESTPAPPKPSASAPKPREPVPTCKAAKQGTYYTLGDSSGGRGKLVDAGTEDVELPFAVELGTAKRYRKGYAVAALTTHGDGSQASVAIVSADAGEGRLLSLGAVHGDVVPPRLAVHGEQLSAAIVDNDAGSQTLRVLAIEPSAAEPVVARGPDFPQGRDDSSAFDLAFSGKIGVLAWDRYDKPSGHAVIEASHFVADDVAGASEPRVVSGKDDDAEMPRIVPRKGGFWLTYVAHGAPPSEQPEASDADVGNVVDITPRRLTIVPLDASGGVSGAPRRLTSELSHVLAYDVVQRGAGALVAWRDDPTTLGVEAPVVYVAHVKPDGSFQTERLEDAEFGAGAPVLLTEPTSNKQHPWLGVMGADQVLRLSRLDEGPKLGTPTPLAAHHRLAEPMARSDGDLLLARPRGRVVDLSVVRCQER